MKKSVSVFLLIFTILVYFGCTEDNPIGPQADQGTASLEKLNKTTFTGTSRFVKPIDPGTTTVLPNGYTLIEQRVVEWYDEASDPRITGRSIWTVDQIISPDGAVKYGGSTELIVDGSGGKWEMWWHGSIVGGIGIANAYCVGVEGAVKGLYAKSIYTIDLTVGPPPTSFYEVEGFILER